MMDEIYPKIRACLYDLMTLAPELDTPAGQLTVDLANAMNKYESKMYPELSKFEF